MANRQPSAGTAITSAGIVQLDPCRFSIEGTVDFSTVPDLLQQVQASLKACTEAKQLVFDFSQIKACNSAALALTLEIVKLGRQAKLNLRLENLPDSLQQIAKVYGIDTEIRDFFK